MAIPKFLRNIFSSSEVEFDDFERPLAITEQAATPEPDMPAAPDADIPAELLDAIASVINAQLPPVVARCIDPEAERAFLAAQLGQPLVEFAESLKLKAVSELTGDRAKMQAELEELRAQRKEVSGKREEQKAALLSEQRQRRALSDRNRDLEGKIEELASEIEQHKLTIASLMNKMRVAEVTEGDSAALRDDLADLREQLSAKDKELNAKAEELNAKAEELNAKIEELTAKDEEITSLSEKLAELQTAAAVAESLEKRREAEGDASGDKQKRRRGSRRPKPQAYDPDNDTSAELDSVDWLLPGGVPAGHTPQVSDPDFGYQPPKHTPAPDSDLQLTLF